MALEWVGATARGLKWTFKWFLMCKWTECSFERRMEVIVSVLRLSSWRIFVLLRPKPAASWPLSRAKQTMTMQNTFSISVDSLRLLHSFFQLVEFHLRFSPGTGWTTSGTTKRKNLEIANQKVHNFSLPCSAVGASFQLSPLKIAFRFLFFPPFRARLRF